MKDRRSYKLDPNSLCISVSTGFTLHPQRERERSMKFIADVMLGRLAKRMRLLGLDVLYDRTLEENEIIRFSLEQDRVILTRDDSLADRPLAAQHLFISGDSARAQIEQVLAAYPSETINPLTRCSQCNALLLRIAKQEARDRVPEYVYARTADFLQCPQCGRTYWKGTHVRRMALKAEKK